MSLLLPAIFFTVPLVCALVVWGWTTGRDRRQLRRAFAVGRAESIVRLPQPVEPMPVFGRVA